MIRGFYTGEIMPTPRQVTYHRAPWVLEARSAVGLVLGERPAPAALTAARELQQEFQECGLKRRAPIIRAIDRDEAFDLIILLGTPATHRRLAAACRKHGFKLAADYPGREGYLIRFFEEGGRRVILCGGSDPAGAYFAAQSLKQLCQACQGGMAIRPAAVDDAPYFGYRGMFVGTRSRSADNACPRGPADWMAAADSLAQFKFNSWDIVYTWHGYRWRNPEPAYRRTVQALVREARRRGLDATLYVNPLLAAGWEYGGDKICISNPRDIDALYRTFRIALAAGARRINLCLDDFTSLAGGPATNYILTDLKDRRVFGGDVGRAHAHLSRRLYAKMKRDFPAAELIVVPAYYSLPGALGQPVGDAYLRALGELPRDIIIQWTGPGVRSPSIDGAAVREFTRLIQRQPAYWDNTIYGLHSPPYYLFDLFAAGYCRQFPRLTGYGMHANGGTMGPINKVGLIQIADYLWNPAAYDAAKARRRALRLVAGASAVKALVRFHDLFEELHDRHPFLHLQRAQPAPVDQETWRHVRRRLGELDDLMPEIERRCANPDLTAALKRDFYEPLRKRAAAYNARRLVKRHLARRVPEGLELPAGSFMGGIPSSKNGVAVAMINGQASSCHQMRALFYLRCQPRQDGLLSVKAVDGLDKPDPRPTRIRISLNGHVVFTGPSEFTLEFFYIRAYDVRRSWLQQGRNELLIENLEPAYMRNFRIASVKLIGPFR